MSGLSTRWDWYEMTIEIDGSEIEPPARTAAQMHARSLDRWAGNLAILLGARLVSGKARNGYAVCWEVVRGEDVLASVHSHSARAGEIHITITSESCDEVVPAARLLWPRHRVSRADSSVDFAADFAHLDALAVALAEDAGVSYRLVTDSAGGATRYLGAPSSELRLRVYKKSEQLVALHPERAADVPPGIVRVELQARPGKRDVKEAVSMMEPDDLWGLGGWSAEVAASLLGFEAPRLPTHFRRPTDWARSVHYLGVQYGPMASKRAASVGLAQARVEVLAALGLSEG